eukprot:Gb_34165 [translate_table: standard]
MHPTLRVCKLGVHPAQTMGMLAQGHRGALQVCPSAPGRTRGKHKTHSRGTPTHPRRTPPKHEVETASSKEGAARKKEGKRRPQTELIEAIQEGGAGFQLTCPYGLALFSRTRFELDDLGGMNFTKPQSRGLEEKASAHQIKEMTNLKDRY